MREAPSPAFPSARKLRIGSWLALAAAAAIILGFAVASAANYSSIVVARATVYVVPQYDVRYTGLGANGKLGLGGSVSVAVTARVENPSSRALHISTVGFSAWTRDGPVEAGLNESRRSTDDILIGPNGTVWFFRVFGESAEITGEPIPPQGNRTFTFTYTMTATTDAARFAGVRNITDYAVDRGGSPNSVPWNHYLYLVLTIDGVPEATSPTAPTYLRNLRRIEREMGVNLVG